MGGDDPREEEEEEADDEECDAGGYGVGDDRECCESAGDDVEKSCEWEKCCAAPLEGNACSCEVEEATGRPSAGESADECRGDSESARGSEICGERRSRPE